MNQTKQSNDSKDSKRGDFFQAVVAIKYAFNNDFMNFNVMTFEHYGDVSFDNKIQIECKHHKNKPSLSDTCEDFWKTLYNWLVNEKEFDKYVLFTTDHFPNSKNRISQLSKWNKAITGEQRWDILNEITFDFSLSEFNEYKITERNIKIIKTHGISDDVINQLVKFKNKQYNNSKFTEILNSLDNISCAEMEILLTELKDTSSKKYEVWNYSRYILKCQKSKIIPILEKINIETDQPIDDDLINEIALHPTFKEIERPAHEISQIIKNIAGIINSKVEGEGRFEVNNSQFYKMIFQEKKDFYKENYRPIFDKYNTCEAPINISSTFENYKFVNELKEIQCENDELEEAVVDYWKTINLLDEEESNSPGFTLQEYVPFKSEIHSKIKTKKRDFKNPDTSNVKKDNSLVYYRAAKQIIVYNRKSIVNFPYFVHGTMQNIVEDDELKFSWKL